MPERKTIAKDKVIARNVPKSQILEPQGIIVSGKAGHSSWIWFRVPLEWVRISSFQWHERPGWLLNVLSTTEIHRTHNYLSVSGSIFIFPSHTRENRARPIFKPGPIDEPGQC